MFLRSKSVMFGRQSFTQKFDVKLQCSSVARRYSIGHNVLRLGVVADF